MAIARKCDRCGKFYDHYSKGVNTLYNGAQRMHRDLGGSFGYEKSFDLCPECMDAFDEFMIDGKFMEEKHE